MTESTTLKIPEPTHPVSWRLMRVVIAGALTMVLGCGSPCDNEIVSSQSSPDGRLKAVIFIRSCGATTPVVTELSVLPVQAGVPQGSANILTLIDDPYHPVQRTTEAIQVILKWESSLRLHVSFPRAAVADKRAVQVNGIGIEYSTF